MTKLKAYDLGINGMPRHEVIAALGLPSWVRQVNITVAESTKAAAHTLLETRRIFISLRDPEFHVDESRQTDALRAAGLLDEPGVYATPMSGSGMDPLPVVRILAGGLPEFVGVLRRIDREWVFSREQMPEVAS